MRVVFLFLFFFFFFFFFSSRRRHTRYIGDWSSDVCSSDLGLPVDGSVPPPAPNVKVPVELLSAFIITRRFCIWKPVFGVCLPLTKLSESPKLRTFSLPPWLV